MNNDLYGSREITSDNNETNSLDFILTKALQKINTMMPAEIAEDQEEDSFFVSVKISVNNLDGNMNPISQPTIHNVPVNFIGGGDIGIITNYKKGDKVIVGFCSRDISVFKKTFKQSNVNLFNVCDIQDAVVLCSLRNKKYKNYIKITDDGIEILTDKDIKIECQNATIKATNILLDGDVNLGGNGGSLVLNSDAKILDGDGKNCTIVSTGTSKTKAQ